MGFDDKEKKWKGKSRFLKAHQVHHIDQPAIVRIGQKLHVDN